MIFKGIKGLFGGLFSGIAAVLALMATPSAQALTAEQALRMAQAQGDDRVAALNEAMSSASPALAALVQAMLDDAVKMAGERVFIVRDGQAKDAVTQSPTPLPGDAEDITINNRMRRELDNARAALQLISPERSERARAIDKLKDGIDSGKAALVERALAAETDPLLKKSLQTMLARALINAPERSQRLQAAKTLAESAEPSTRSLLIDRVSQERDPEVKAALTAALKTVDSSLAWGERWAVLFTGLSLGSILLLAALGLAITYGLMGVINMAHGELMMVGAYATYVVQNFFKSHAPAAFDAYIIAAIPASFLAAALVGMVMERTVIRWLYGRPLETLLATWGISLILMQGVRSIFGAQNVQVENPSWLSGGIQVLGNLTLPYNRLALLVFVALVLVGVALLINKTRLGLFVRGVTQNRRMASCVGVNTARVDTYAFALGAGMAGLAGCALSQIGNVGPDLGQSYIVDSFMVVVLGGVGQLAGTVVAALSLGIVNKLLEGMTGAVLAKIMVLIFIVVFIQKRPQGLFALKGRSAEA